MDLRFDDLWIFNDAKNDEKRTIEVYFEHSFLWEMKTVSGEKKFCFPETFDGFKSQLTWFNEEWYFCIKRYMFNILMIKF